jgi:hypothetical protein
VNLGPQFENHGLEVVSTRPISVVELHTFASSLSTTLISGLRTEVRRIMGKIMCVCGGGDRNCIVEEGKVTHCNWHLVITPPPHTHKHKQKKNSVALSPQANYTD